MSADTEADALPTIETISRVESGRPLRGRCLGCGESGPAGLDRFIILHDKTCPHAQEGGE